MLGPLLGDLGKGLWNVIRAGQPLGNQIFKALADSAKEFRKWTESASGQNTIAKWFKDAKAPLFEMGKLIRDVGAAFFDLGADRGLTDLIRTLRKDMLPVIVDVLKAGRDFGPVFVDFAVEAMKAFKPFLGASGALTLMVKALTGVLRIFNDLIETVPMLGTVLANMVAGAGIVGLFSKLGSKFSGLGSALGGKMGLAFAGAFALGSIIAEEVDNADDILREKTRGWTKDIEGALSGPARGVLPSLTAEALKVGKLDQYIAKMKQVGTVIDVSMVRGWVAAGKVTVAQGAKIIKSIKETQQAAARARKDIAEDEGFGLARQMALDGKMLPQEVNKAMQRLDALPPKMRKFAIESMVHFTAGLEAAGQAPKGATDKLIDRLEDRSGELPKKVEKQAQKLADGVKKGTDRAADITERYGKGTMVVAERASSKVAEQWEWGFGKVANQAQTKGGKFRNAVAQSFWGGANASADAMGHMATETNKTLKSLGGAKGKDVYVAKFGKMAEKPQAAGQGPHGGRVGS